MWSIYLDSRVEEEEGNMCAAYLDSRGEEEVDEEGNVCTLCAAYLDSRGEEEVEEEGNMCAAYTWTRVVRRR